MSLQSNAKLLRHVMHQGHMKRCFSGKRDPISFKNAIVQLPFNEIQLISTAHRKTKTQIFHARSKIISPVFWQNVYKWTKAPDSKFARFFRIKNQNEFALGY